MKKRPLSLVKGNELKGTERLKNDPSVIFFLPPFSLLRIKLISIIAITLLSGCASDEHPSYDPIRNSLPSDGPTINYDPNSSLTNVAEIEEFLNEDNTEIFTKSLSWYGTESNFGFDNIHNKNARELVDIVNCLKTSTADKQDKCFK